MKSPNPNAAPFMAAVKLGPKGQIVIPKEVRDMFGVEPGDTLVLLAHPQQGIALERPQVLSAMADAIFDGRAAEGSQVFAQEVKKTLRGEDT